MLVFLLSCRYANFLFRLDNTSLCQFRINLLLQRIKSWLKFSEANRKYLSPGLHTCCKQCTFSFLWLRKERFCISSLLLFSVLPASGMLHSDFFTKLFLKHLLIRSVPLVLSSDSGIF